MDIFCDFYYIGIGFFYSNSMSSKRDLIRQTLYPSNVRKNRSQFKIGYGNDDADDDYDHSGSTQLVRHQNNIYNDREDNDETDETDETDEDCDDNDDDGAVVNLNQEVEKSNVRYKNSQVTAPIHLPGGTATVSTVLKQQNNQRHIGEIPQDLVVKIRRYMDILFSSVLLQAHQILKSEPKSDSVYALPGVVMSILQYNNVEFRTVKYVLTKFELPEPIWYTINVARNELILYINNGMYGTFCAKNNVLNVNFTSGIIPLELHNPLVDVTDGVTIDWPMIHCAIAADHVAQHILTDLFGKLKTRNADIHENFANHGTTLHSMFRIEQFCRNNQPSEINNYISMMPMYQQPQQYCANPRYVQPTNATNILNELINGFTPTVDADLVSSVRPQAPQPPLRNNQFQAPQLPDFST